MACSLTSLLERCCPCPPALERAFPSGLCFAAQTDTPAGCTPRVDSLLAGGLRPGEVVELCGPPASGKTQVGTLCVALSLPYGGFILAEQ